MLQRSLISGILYGGIYPVFSKKHFNKNIMKDFIYKTICLASILTVFTGCERDLETEGITKKITYYAVIKPNTIMVEGEPAVDVVVESGTDFTDPGATVTENGAPIDYETDITGTYFLGGVDKIDTSVPDIYNVTYSAVNVDGYAGAAARTVTVLPAQGDLVTSIEGLYTATVKRTPGGGPAAADYTDREYVIIRKVDADTYELSDAIGGYYDFGRVYGPTFAATGARVTAVNIPSNNFTFDNTVGAGEFGGVVKITSMDVNPAAKTVHFVSTWDSGYDFDVTLTQVQY
jgi:hypothetical protein